ncbi:MAG TPA: hypothetical protein VIG93_07465 [Gaiellaceae bacterium]
MSVLERPGGERRLRRRRTIWRRLAVALALVLVFLVGIAFGQALDDTPDRGGVTTTVRTLEPLPQEPPPRTVTVTVTQP